MSDDLGFYLARLARIRALSPATLDAAAELTVREFCLLVLQELVARGLVEGEAEIGCYAAARTNAD